MNICAKCKWREKNEDGDWQCSILEVNGEAAHDMTRCESYAPRPWDIMGYHQESRILELTIKQPWFGMILSGAKDQEYREIKPYWTKRLTTGYVYVGGIKRFGLPKDYDAVRFRNGYNNNSPWAVAEWVSTFVRDTARHPNWGEPEGPHFVIQIGRVVASGNILPIIDDDFTSSKLIGCVNTLPPNGSKEGGEK